MSKLKDASKGIIQVPASNYLERHYDTKGRFCSYWHQIDELLRAETDSILEIGVGNGFTYRYMKQHGLNVETLDLDPELKPSFVGSVTDMPIADESYDCVACFEVLEHLPFESFAVALAQIHRVARRRAIVSLPDASRSYRLLARLPFGIKIKMELPFPNYPPRTLPSDSNHFWEIGTKGFPLRRIESEFERAGFTITKTYRVFEFVCHRFFVLAKRKGSNKCT